MSRVVTVLRVDEELAKAIDEVRATLAQEQGIALTRTAVATAALWRGLPTLSTKRKRFGKAGAL